MPTQAISAYGIQLRVGSGVSPGGMAISNATGITGQPITITTTAHGIVDISVVTVAGVTGNIGTNGTWIASAINPTQLLLRGSATAGNYTGGGTATVTDTFVAVAELTNLQDGGVMATLVDSSAHDGNQWTSRVPTLLSGNTLRLSINLVPGHPTHNPSTGLEFLMLTKARRRMMIVFPDAAKTAWLFTGFVAGHRAAAPVAGLLTAETTIEFDGEAVLAAA